MIQRFENAIRNGIIKIDMVNNDENLWTEKIREFNSNKGPRNLRMNKEKESIQNSSMTLLKRRKMVFNAFKDGIFPMPSKKRQKNQISHFHQDFMTEHSNQNLQLTFYQKTLHADDQLKEDESEYYHQNNWCKDCLEHLHKYKPVILLEMYQSRFDRLSIHCTMQSKSPNKYTTIQGRIQGLIWTHRCYRNVGFVYTNDTLWYI